MKLKKLLTALGMAFVFAVGNIPAQAANVVEIPSTELDSVYNQSVQSNEIEGWAKGPQIYSESGIVMDIDSGAILYAKNIDDQHYPASITKILTALVALENTQMTDTVSVKQEDISFLEYGDSHIGLKPGEEISMEDAMYGMLLASGNEVSHAIASSTEGGYDNFLKMMNDKAKELGCTNSNFMNTHGLHDPEHYTSARDMALISAEVFKYEEFRKITATRQHTIPETNITNETRTFQQNHKMLFSGRREYYEYCVGGKTGYTDQSLNTLVTFATKDDVNLVAVVLRTHGGNVNSYGATRAMLDYAFDNFSKVPVAKNMVQAEGLESVDSDAYVMLPEGITFSDLTGVVTEPTELGDKTGYVTYYYKDLIVGKVRTTITDEYYNQIHGIEDIAEEPAEKSENDSVLFVLLKVVLIILGVLVGLFLLLICFVVYRRKQIQKRRRARRMQHKREFERRNS